MTAPVGGAYQVPCGVTKKKLLKVIMCYGIGFSLMSMSMVNVEVKE